LDADMDDLAVLWHEKFGDTTLDKAKRHDAYIVMHRGMGL
jgi:hypothetical protein